MYNYNIYSINQMYIQIIGEKLTSYLTNMSNTWLVSYINDILTEKVKCSVFVQRKHSARINFRNKSMCKNSKAYMIRVHILNVTCKFVIHATTQYVHSVHKTCICVDYMNYMQPPSCELSDLHAYLQIKILSLWVLRIKKN